ncbi:EAL domain-containing protein [Yersinia sp. 22-579]|uniref:EAL domain-containing protein n=1 Tax=Yersinia sp. 22-579 TaxID=3057580 RepID=UPI00263AD362|nr:EAL domain-containing protein [Yersinia sp. 22-579]EKN6178913.1 EAL domain-containing protein [Yersinia enterocolitica]
MKYSKNTLSSAIERNEFIPFYQPIVDPVTHKIVGCEMLARWLKPNRGLVCASDFILDIEEHGLLELLTRKLLRSMMMELERTSGSFPSGFRVNLNVNISLLNKSNFFTYLIIVNEELLRLNFSLIAEITEREDISRFPEAKEIFNHMAGQGINFAIDDFGTKFANFKLVDVVKAKTLKLDKLFANNIGDEDLERLMIKAIITAHALGARVIAEGIETSEQNEYFKKMNVDFVQGYFHGSPMPFELFHYRLSHPTKRNNQYRSVSDYEHTYG